MENEKKMAMLYTRINGVEKLAVNNVVFGKGAALGSGKGGLTINRQFHEALGLKVGGVR